MASPPMVPIFFNLMQMEPYYFYFYMSCPFHLTLFVILIYWACCHKVPETGVDGFTERNCVMVLEAGSPR